MSNIKSIVNKLLLDINFKGTKVPVKRVAETLGLKIKEEYLEDNISGFLYKKGKKPTIVVNEDHPLVRRRFTIAHEIGHYVLGHSGDLFLDRKYILFRDSKSSDGSLRVEKQANKFAAELLMPEESILYEIENRNIDFDDDNQIVNLARAFGVSSQALLIRLSNVGVLKFM